VKKVEALIRTSSLNDVIQALERLDVGGVTVSEVASCGGDRLRGSYRGASYLVDASPAFRVEVVATDAYAGPIAWAIATAARAGRPDDGVVSIQPVENALRIRTGEHGVAAVSASLDVADEAQAALSLRGSPAVSDGIGRSDSAKVLLTNVVLSTVFVVTILHAPVGYAALGATSAGLLLWLRGRWARRPR
jgi:nitrogen regulatory protein P-II 1